ncbi:BREX system P-loop protein BrxC [Candidatus Kaistella beijingensis]|uniref:BREX system P-loop protein BrxC n=1 Tax=Candidatus Kaistella beijingensis TaxID=2820270 RepID=UPI001CC7ECBB|nr:BREX system P-loop protein BrxC [Candidatus Kaistella beijingensis]UBB90910.1 BREX system P-loop protein BrxC [Candidatus Kaistella beijingensis]
MKLQSIYLKEIDRHINPAVVVGDMDSEHIKQEIEEYVFTKDIIKNLYKFLNAVVNKTEGKTGIWISGYYGSGKSHFIKYLFYCLNLDTREKAFACYKDAISNNKELDVLDEVTLSNVSVIESKLNKMEVEEIIFNIDAVSESQKNNDTITRILLNQLNAKRGFNSSNITLAQLVEKHLQKIGKFEDFKNKIKADFGVEWRDGNISNFVKLKRDLLIDTAHFFDAEIDKESLKESLKDKTDFTIADLIHELKEYVKEKPENYRLVFLMDEVSQYIGTNTSLLLNLQTIVEEVGKALGSKVWIVCTAQQDLSNLVNNTENKSDGFGKIMGRFETMISLDAQDAAYIAQKRLLEKNASGSTALIDYYQDNKGGIQNQFVFDHDLYKNYHSPENFYLAYPFVPYQFRLISDVFQSFSTVGFVGEGVRNTERAILGITHFTAKEQMNQDVGYFISFDNFFNDQLSKNLTHAANSILNRGFNIDFDDKAFANRVMKVLFMISNLDESLKINFPATVENLALLLINDIKTVKIELQQRVQKILDILVDKNIVQMSEGKYRFLDNDGIQVANSITATTVNNGILLKYFYEQFIKRYLNPQQNINIGNRNIKINLSIDDKEESTGGEFNVKFVLYDGTDLHQKAMNIPSSELNVNIAEWFNQNPDFKKDFLTYARTTKYLEDNRGNATGERVKTIEEFGVNNIKLLRELQTRFEKLFAQTSYTSQNQVIEGNRISTSNPANRFQEMLQNHVKSVYKNHDWSNQFANTNDDLKNAIAKSLVMPETDNSLNLAEQEVNNRITNSGNAINLSELVKQFEKAPYGWKDLATLHIVFNIVRKKHRSFYYLNDELELKNFFDKAINSASRSGIEVKAVKDYNQDEVKEFRNALKDIFIGYQIPEGEEVNETVQGFHQFLGDQLLAVNKYREEYEGYPFSNSIRQYHKSLAELRETKSNEKVISKTVAEKEILQQQRDRFTAIKDFIDHHFNNYSEIRKYISDEKANLEKLDETHENAVSIINAYMATDADPGIQFPAILKYYKDLKKAVALLLEDFRTKVLEKYNAVFDELEERKTELKLEESHIFADRKTILQKLENSKSISELEIAELRAHDFKLDNIKLLVDEHNKKQVAEKGGEYGKHITTFSVSKTISGETVSTPEEVDKIIDKLRSRIMIELSKNKNGKIILS